MSNLNVSRRINKPTVIALIILFVLVISILYWLSPAHIPNNNNSMNADLTPHTASEQSTAITTASTIELPRVENLIRGLETSPDGHLKITGKTRDVLDAFIGDQSTELTSDMMGQIKNQFDQKMKEPAVTEAITLLQHYAAYKKELADMDSSTPQIAQQNDGRNLMAGVRMQRISVLRNEYFSPEIVQIFYANDDANAQYMLARQQIMSISGLSDEQRQEELTALQNQFQKTVANTFEK